MTRHQTRSAPVDLLLWKSSRCANVCFLFSELCECLTDRKLNKFTDSTALVPASRQHLTGNQPIRRHLHFNCHITAARLITLIFFFSTGRKFPTDFHRRQLLFYPGAEQFWIINSLLSHLHIFSLETGNPLSLQLSPRVRGENTSRKKIK